MTGVQLVTGASVSQPGMFGVSQTRKVDTERLAVLVLLASLAAPGATFLKGKAAQQEIAGGAVLGAILQVALKPKLDNAVARDGEVRPSVRPRPGVPARHSDRGRARPSKSFRQPQPSRRYRHPRLPPRPAAKRGPSDERPEAVLVPHRRFTVTASVSVTSRDPCLTFAGPSTCLPLQVRRAPSTPGRTRRARGPRPSPSPDPPR
jgi:hypothetical protein